MELRLGSRKIGPLTRPSMESQKRQCLLAGSRVHQLQCQTPNLYLRQYQLWDQPRSAIWASFFGQNSSMNLSWKSDHWENMVLLNHDSHLNVRSTKSKAHLDFIYVSAHEILLDSDANWWFVSQMYSSQELRNAWPFERSPLKSEGGDGFIWPFGWNYYRVAYHPSQKQVAWDFEPALSGPACPRCSQEYWWEFHFVSTSCHFGANASSILEGICTVSHSLCMP